MKKSNNRHERRSAVKEELSFARILAFSLISGGVGAIASVIFIVVCSFTALSKENPEKLISIFGITIPALSYFFAGYLSYKLSRRAPIVCGTVCATALMLLIKLFSFIFKAGIDSSLGAYVKAMLCVLYIFASILGAIIAANLSFSPKKDRKRRR